MNYTLEKPIVVSEKIQKMVEGSTEFNIEDFMNESEVENYIEWLKVKDDLEKNLNQKMVVVKTKIKQNTTTYN